MKLFYKLGLSFIILFFSVSIFIIRVMQVQQPDILFDDAFISFRYAHNLTSGHGLVYNPGERVEGYTNFLWIVLLAGFDFLRFDLNLASQLLAFLSATGIIVVMAYSGLWRNHPNKQALPVIALGLFSVSVYHARFVFSGMETMLFTFLLTSSIVFSLFIQSPLLAGISFAVCAMTRPEGVMYFLVTIGYAFLLYAKQKSSGRSVSATNTFFGQKKISLSTLVIFLSAFVAVFGIYFTWRFAYYGHPFPNTFYAKVNGDLMMNLKNGGEALLALLSQWGLWPLLVLPLFLIRKIKEENNIYLVTLVLITVFYFLAVGGDFIVWFGPRLLMPVFPVLYILNARGFEQLISYTKRNAAIISRGVLLVVPFLLCYEYLFSWPRDNNLEIFAIQMRGWKEMGIWIKENTDANIAIATDAAGLIPYFSEKYAIDMFGLTDEHIAHLEINSAKTRAVAHNKVDPYYILERNPSCIISTWLNPNGEAISAGLDEVKEDFNRNYYLVAVAKVRKGLPDDGKWVLETNTYTGELYEKGYWTGLFCQRSDL